MWEHVESGKTPARPSVLPLREGSVLAVCDEGTQATMEVGDLALGPPSELHPLHLRT